MNNFVNIADFSAEQLRHLLVKARADKNAYKQGELKPTLQRKTLAMIFEKPSLRTRVSFEAGMTHLGGHAIYLAPADIGLNTREPAKDVARVLASMCDIIMARTFSHETIEQLAQWAPVPVINALSDYSHPCQAMADIMTAMEAFGDDLSGRTLTFVGDGNNVARSLAVLCVKLGMRFILASPPEYRLEEGFFTALRRQVESANVSESDDPIQAVNQADIIYTDTWVSMGQEEEKRKRLRDFEGYQVNTDLLARAPDHAIVMHCLPAYRGCEISDEAFEAHAETIIREAENRLHLQRSLMEELVLHGRLR
jgi:ornithine carbamoyltransferase